METNSSEKTFAVNTNRKKRRKAIIVDINLDKKSDSESYSDEESDNNNIEQAPKSDDVVVKNKRRNSVSKVKENEDVFEGEKTFFIVSYIIGILVFGAVGLALSVPLGPIGMMAGTAIGIGFGFGFTGAVEAYLAYSPTLFSTLFATGATITGTGIGAMLGTILFPGVGSIIGAAIGAAIGAGIGAGVGFSVAGITTLFTENKLAGTLLLGAGTTILGAGIGAILGTIFIPLPGIGTAIGAGIGAGVGFGIVAIPALITTLCIKIKKWINPLEFSYIDPLVDTEDTTVSNHVINKGLGETAVESDVISDQPNPNEYVFDLGKPKNEAPKNVVSQSTTTPTTTHPQTF